jgi:hypothetical protein
MTPSGSAHGPARSLVIWADVLCGQPGDPPRAVLGLDLGAEFGSPAPHLLVSDGRQMTAASPSAVSAGQGTGAGPAPSWWMIRAQLAGWRPAM